ncbi:hypothetical protein CEXT_708111 [Caerostris extrusa]|uniref:Uncharacterized protein n=1 Tax=Caerostris extrusa TaxID=172846 RepID=A0AAV4SC39_CAEEX|nr:hypothetical protein CEXT_708111 [Caerostris extrusa]
MQLPKIASSISRVTNTGIQIQIFLLQIAHDRRNLHYKLFFPLPQERGREKRELVENNNKGKRLPVSETDKVFKRSGIFSLPLVVFSCYLKILGSEYNPICCLLVITTSSSIGFYLERVEKVIK